MTKQSIGLRNLANNTVEQASNETWVDETKRMVISQSEAIIQLNSNQPQVKLLGGKVVRIGPSKLPNNRAT